MCWPADKNMHLSNTVTMPLGSQPPMSNECVTKNVLGLHLLDVTKSVWRNCFKYGNVAMLADTGGWLEMHIDHMLQLRLTW